MHEYTANHPDEVAKWYFDTLKPAGLSVQDLTEILGKLVYHNHPIGQALVDQIRITAEDLKLVKVLEPDDRSEGLRRAGHGQPSRLSSVDEQCDTSALEGRAASAPSIARGASDPAFGFTALLAAAAWAAAAIITVGLPDVVPWGSAGLFAGDHRRRRALSLASSHSSRRASAASATGLIHYGPWFIAIGVWLALWELTTAKFGWLPKPFFSPPNGLLNVYVTEAPRLLICIGYTLRLWGARIFLRHDGRLRDRRGARLVEAIQLLGHADPEADWAGAGDRLDSCHILFLSDHVRRERLHRGAGVRNSGRRS